MAVKLNEKKKNEETLRQDFNLCRFLSSYRRMATKTDDSTLKQMLHNPLQREEGFKALMSQYGQMLYWHIRRIVVGHCDAEDVLQETCIKVFSRIDTFRGDGSLTIWLYRIATNEALQHLRRQTHLFQSVDSLGEALAGKLQAENPLDGNELEMLFQAALLTLPTQQRIAFNMRYYDELSYEEIAQITGKNVASLKTNYHYATQKVKDYIREHTAR